MARDDAAVLSPLPLQHIVEVLVAVIRGLPEGRDVCGRVVELTLPMPKGRGFLVRRPLRRLRGIGVLHDLPKREFPCDPRYVLFPFTQLWICLPKPYAECSLRHSHPCRDAFRMLDNPIRGHLNPLSVDSDSRRRSKSDSTGRRYRL